MPGHAKVIADVLWGSKLSYVGQAKVVVVVDADIDPWNMAMVEWATSWIIKPGDDVHVWPNTRGGMLDPSVLPENKGFLDRVLIDATRPFHWAPRDLWGSEGVGKGRPLKFPPTARPSPEVMEEVNSKWDSYGVKPVVEFVGSPRGIFCSWWSEEIIEKIKKGEIPP